MRSSVIFIASLMIILTGQTNNCLPQNSIPDNFCISKEELKLFNFINDYRKVLKLPAVPLSRSLSYVAKQHINDLVQNSPDTGRCSFHSWSDKGKWSPCCYNNVKAKKCMHSKPAELTEYPGYGYEIVYWENNQATANNAFEQWRTVTASRSIITNTNEWEGYYWKAMGVAIEKNFAIVWFGEEPDPETETHICGSDQVIKYVAPKTPADSLVVNKSTGRYYIIFGSFKSLDEAKKRVKRYRAEGFRNAKVVTKDNKFRISLSDYSSQQSAIAAKKSLPTKYKEAWILPY